MASKSGRRERRELCAVLRRLGNAFVPVLYPKRRQKEQKEENFCGDAATCPKE